jgi:hypothetical protein
MSIVAEDYDQWKIWYAFADDKITVPVTLRILKIWYGYCERKCHRCLLNF